MKNCVASSSACLNEMCMRTCARTHLQEQNSQHILLSKEVPLLLLLQNNCRLITGLIASAQRQAVAGW
jgi:hypothetical protein